MTNSSRFTHQGPRRAVSFARQAILAAALASGLSASASAQYFGRNKVPYERFHFDVLRTPHFDVHYYAAEQAAAKDAARMLERWNARYTDLFSHPLSARKPIILYADQPDFQQTNVISEQLDEGTGGVTESMLDRMVLPLTGSYAESDHVLGHEMVHVYQYDIANSKGGVMGFERLPLWLVEGMAEYLSVGPEDAHTAMWLRDAVQRNDIPTINQLSNSSKYFPYRYGEAVWAYIGGTWGDDAVPRLFRNSLQRGFDDAVRRTLGLSVDSLSKRWHAALKAAYVPMFVGRTGPRATGEPIILNPTNRVEYNVSPSLSPDGKLVAFFSTRGFRGVQLLVADATTGVVKSTVASPGVSTKFDALSFLYSAGSWSPDAKRLAFVSYAEGDNEIVIADVSSGKMERRIKPAGIGAISTVAWSPDGAGLAFSGMDGGVSDLFIYDLAAGTTRRLTNDLHADLQPAWSPDGKTLAFVTDRPMPAEGPQAAAPGSDFQGLSYAPLRLALLDVASGEVRVLPAFPKAKHLNPEFAPDGKSLYFVSDEGGISDVYRIDIESCDVFQVTRTTTGISGIAETSPAISVARTTGRVVFSVFEKGGFHIAAVPAAQSAGVALGSIHDAARPAPGATPVSAALLPAERTVGGSAVQAYLDAPARGLPTDTSSFANRGYTPGLRLAAIGQPSLGVGVGGGFGTQVVGSASAYFTDVLGDHGVLVAAQASGSLRDVGGQLAYVNSARRWAWGASVSRIPYVLGYTGIRDTVVTVPGNGTFQGTSIDYIIEHLAFSDVALQTQFARSQANRVELSAGYSRYDYSLEAQSQVYVGNTYIGSDRTQLGPSVGLGYNYGTIAYVGDDASMGFTSPIAGTRYRLEATPAFGQLNFQTYLADFRKYAFHKPVTLAFRALHYGRYGHDADDPRMGTLFLGDGSLVRGYSYDSFNADECVPSSGGAGSLGNSSCPQFDRLLGSRLALVNFELRIPLIGQQGLGLLESSFPPLEISPFVDAGVAWRGSSMPSWKLVTNSSERTPVVSAGVASRINLFGFAVGQVYYAHPFMRPGRGGVWGFVLQPGW